MKLLVRIEPSWFHGVHEVEVDIDPNEFEGIDLDDPREKLWFDNQMHEIATDAFNEAVSWGWEVIE